MGIKVSELQTKINLSFSLHTHMIDILFLWPGLMNEKSNKKLIIKKNLRMKNQTGNNMGDTGKPPTGARISCS